MEGKEIRKDEGEGRSSAPQFSSPETAYSHERCQIPYTDFIVPKLQVQSQPTIVSTSMPIYMSTCSDCQITYVF